MDCIVSPVGLVSKDGSFNFVGIDDRLDGNGIISGMGAGTGGMKGDFDTLGIGAGTGGTRGDIDTSGIGADTGGTRGGFDTSEMGAANGFVSGEFVTLGIGAGIGATIGDCDKEGGNGFDDFPCGLGEGFMVSFPVVPELTGGMNIEGAVVLGATGLSVSSTTGMIVV